MGELELCEQPDNIYWRARYEFLEVHDQRIDELLRPHGTVEVFRQLVSEAIHVVPRPVDDGGVLANNVLATLHGEICVESDSNSSVGWAMPVLADFGFERLGRRLVARPMLNSIRKHGSPRRCHPYEELEYAGGMTFDGG